MQRLRVGTTEWAVHIQGQGAPLVLLHGLGGSHHDWDAQIDFFARQRRVIAPDLRGFGQTPRGHGRLSVPILAREVDLLCQALGISRCQVIGHSMGGAIAQQWTLDHPQRIESLVLANTLPSFRPRRVRHMAEFALRYAVMGALGPKRLAHISARRNYPDPAQRQMAQHMIARSAANSRRAYLSALRALSRWSVVERLPQLRLPVLICAAEHDYFEPQQIQQFVAALPQAQLHVFARAHHQLPSEYADDFNRIVNAFLRSGAQQKAA
ncbi:alpha/beta fold hydrolase [Sinimarinibacterium sp. NLF-5-8]|uniref:alpha/beta fold hydrolase n=1 Tax=Sinimarinibacterium sp. NLF-5-8 TaxID=2698684 RepID=UPI00137BBDE2|nr:alpha/beta hydrolase [Sinimarinibacterium sp. NLF-5-8]QHS08784.1 alpha/beta hydrolase [Sinimarinibacterium sp. NLF-5-8]